VFAKGREANLCITSVISFSNNSVLLNIILLNSLKLTNPKISPINPSNIIIGTIGRTRIFTNGATIESVPKVFKVKGKVPTIAAIEALKTSEIDSGILNFLKKVAKDPDKKNSPSKLPKLNCRLTFVQDSG